MVSKSLIYVTHSIQGVNRDKNKDGVVCIDTDAYSFLCVFDGVSSSAFSQEAVIVVKEFFETNHSNYLKQADIEESLLNFVIDANATLISKELEGQTTLTGVYYNKENGVLFFVNVGDSRAYETSTQFLRQLTTDHNIDTNRNVLTKCLGMVSLKKEDVELFSLELNNKSRILLCTDGFYSVLEERPVNFNNLLQIDFKQVTEQIVKEISGKNQDDATYILIQFNV